MFLKISQRVLMQPGQPWHLGNTIIAHPVSYGALTFLLCCKVGETRPAASLTVRCVIQYGLVLPSLFIVRCVGAQEMRRPHESWQ